MSKEKNIVRGSKYYCSGCGKFIIDDPNAAPGGFTCSLCLEDPVVDKSLDDQIDSNSGTEAVSDNEQRIYKALEKRNLPTIFSARRCFEAGEEESKSKAIADFIEKLKLWCITNMPHDPGKSFEFTWPLNGLLKYAEELKDKM